MRKNSHSGVIRNITLRCLVLFRFRAKRWRQTLNSSKNSVFKRLYSRASIVKAMQIRKAERDKRVIEEHPIIYVIVEYFDEMSEFYVALGNVLYKFN